MLPPLDQSVGIEDVWSDADVDPGDTLINLDNEAMVTIRALSTNWALAVRFREWLIDTVFKRRRIGSMTRQHGKRLRERASYAG